MHFSRISPVSGEFRDLEDAVDRVLAGDEPRDRQGEPLGPLAVAAGPSSGRRGRAPEEEAEIEDGGGQGRELHFKGHFEQSLLIVFNSGQVIHKGTAIATPLWRARREI